MDTQTQVMQARVTQESALKIQKIVENAKTEIGDIIANDPLNTVKPRLGIHLQWNAPIEQPGVEVVGYNIWRWDSGGWTEIVENTGNAVTNYVDMDELSPNTTYWYAVRAIGADGSRGDYSESIPARIAPEAPPVNPEGISFAPNHPATPRRVSADCVDFVEKPDGASPPCTDSEQHSAPVEHDECCDDESDFEIVEEHTVEQVFEFDGPPSGIFPTIVKIQF